MTNQFLPFCSPSRCLSALPIALLALDRRTGSRLLPAKRVLVCFLPTFTRDIAFIIIVVCQENLCYRLELSSGSFVCNLTGSRLMMMNGIWAQLMNNVHDETLLEDLPTRIKPKPCNYSMTRCLLEAEK